MGGCKCSGEPENNDLKVNFGSGYSINGVWYPYDYQIVGNTFSTASYNIYDHRTEVALSSTEDIEFEGDEIVSVFLVRFLHDNSTMKLTAKEINLLGLRVVGFDPPKTDAEDKLNQIKNIIEE